MFDNEDMDYVVVMNHEEQYSIWPADREPPAGWQAMTKPMPRIACLDHIEEVWTDMRPKSVRDLMESGAARG